MNVISSRLTILPPWWKISAARCLHWTHTFQGTRPTWPSSRLSCSTARLRAICSRSPRAP
ncbi:unnamed protein product [Ascophyllum nodosum]